MNKYVSPIIEIEEVEVGDIMSESNELPDLDLGGNTGGGTTVPGTGTGTDFPIIKTTVPTVFSSQYFN